MNPIKSSPPASTAARGAAVSQRHAEMVAQACRQLDAAAGCVSLGVLARAARLSPFHFHRVFKAVAGITPKEYGAALRARRLREGMARSTTVTEALYAAGFESPARFYAAAPAALGMRPSQFRQGGSQASIHFAVGQSSLGAVLVACSDHGVCAILLGDDPAQLVQDLEDRFPRARLVGGDRQFEALVAQVVGLVESPGDARALPLDVRGTAFQLRVWQALRTIAPGTTATYSEVARKIGMPRAVRAVAGACAANPVAIAIPCHRVVRRDGDLSGYRWGVERKRELLRREASGGSAPAPA